jgi:hypothetical protein
MSGNLAHESRLHTVYAHEDQAPPADTRPAYLMRDTFLCLVYELKYFPLTGKSTCFFFRCELAA